MADYEGKGYGVDDDVKAALEVIDNFTTQRLDWDAEIDAIQSILNDSFTIQNPQGTKRLSGQLLFQALWRTASRMKPLDFMVHGSGADPEMEKVVRDSISTVMDRGNYDACLRDKNGAFYDLLLYGDAFVMVGANEEGKFPILFSNGTLKNVYVNTSATGVRVPQRGRSARQIVLIFSYTKSEFDKLWPKFKKKVKSGVIQRPKSSKDQQKDWLQDADHEKEVEVAYSYDLDSETYLTFAGPTHEVLERKKGKDYPFFLEEKPYIPILHYLCIPSNEGFRNYGIGHILYRLTIVTRQLMNMEVTHVINNTLPIELVSVAQDRASAFFQGLKKARQMQARGERGFVPMERSATDPSASAVQSQSLISQNLSSEWAALFDRLVQEVRRLGINIDEIDTAGNKTATEIIALEENSNAFVKQIGEWNSSEYQFAVELTMDFIKNFVGPKDKTPLDLTTKIETVNGEQRMDDVTLGNIAEELKKRRWFARVDSRSGNILSNVMLYSRYNSILPYLPPGSPEHTAAIKGISRIFDLEFPKAEAQPQMPQQGGAPDESMPPQVTATDRQELNPNVAVRGPVIQ